MANSQTDDFAVQGMTCGSCAGRVEQALLDREEVSQAKVDLAGARVRVTYETGADLDALFEAVGKIGYEMGPSPDDAAPKASKGLFGKIRRRRTS